MYCQHCGANITSREECNNCGAVLPLIPYEKAENSKICICGYPNHKEAKFCFSCGKSFLTNGNSANPDIDSNLLQILRTQALEGIERYRSKMTGTVKINSNQIRIGLWGPTKSGKTVYLLALYLAAKQSGDGNKENWLIGFNDMDVQLGMRLNEMANNLRKGIWPPPNPPEKADPDIYSLLFYPDPDKLEVKIKQSVNNDPLQSFWKFLTTEPEETVKQKSEPGIAVSFADVAGERYLTEPPESPIWNHLAGCQGLICLLDPEDIDNQLVLTSNLVEILFSKVRKEKKDALIEDRYLPHYVSVCFTKMDKPGWQDMFNNPEAVVQKIEEASDLNLRRQLLVHFSPKRIKFHCVSSVGFEFSPDNKGDQKTARIRPKNVFAPLNEWIQKKK